MLIQPEYMRVIDKQRATARRALGSLLALEDLLAGTHPHAANNPEVRIAEFLHDLEGVKSDLRLIVFAGGHPIDKPYKPLVGYDLEHNVILEP